MAGNKSSSPTGGIPGEANVNAAKELRAAMESMVGITSTLERSFNNQSRAIQEMANAVGKLQMGDIAAQVGQMGDALKKALENIKQIAGQTSSSVSEVTSAAQGAASATQNLAGQIRDAGNAATGAKTSTQDLGSILDEVKESTESLDSKLKKVGKYLKKEHPVAVGAALGAMSGLAQGFRNVIAIGKGVFGIFESLISFAYELGSAIIQIPFKIFDGLLDMARKNAGGSNELAAAIEKVRENFGHLTNETPKAIFATAKSLDKLKLEGTSAFRIFGNLAQRIEKINTLFMAGGPALRNLSGEFIESGAAILGYQKGLGLTDEMIGSIGQQAQTMGKPMTKILNDITKQSLHLGQAFKLDAKIISREMGKATMDMRHFGDVSIKEIGVAVTYAHKLGLDLEKITGIMDQFSTFDSAAENVSKLNEAFGTNISAMEMLQAETPAQQLEILRKEMARVGVDGEKLNRHYRSLISQTTSLDDATIKAAFSSKNQGVSLEEIQKQAGKAEKKTMTQAEAMNKLAGAMERMIQSGGDLGSEGFFGQFFKGIKDGLMSTVEFRRILMNIVQALRIVYMEGRRLGIQIVQLFPGLKEFLGGLADLFSPAKFKKLAGGVTDVIIEWMKGLTDPAKKFSFGDLMEKIKEKFFNFFSMEEPAGRKTISGFKKILDVISVALGEFVKWAAEKLTSFFRFAAEFIKNPSSVINLQGAQDGVMGFLGPLFQAIAESWPALWSSFKELMTVAFQKLFEWVSTSLWPVIEPYMKYVYAGLAIVLFGPAVGQALLGAAVGFFSQLLVKAVAAGATKAAASGLLGEAMKKLFSASQGAGAPAAVPGLTPTLAAAPPPQVVAGAAASGAALQPAQPSIIALLGTLAAIITMGLVAFYFAAKMVEGMSTETVLKAMGALASVMLSSVPAVFAAIAVSKVGDPMSVLKGGAVVAALVALMTLSIIPLVLVMKRVEEIGVSFESVVKTLAILGEVILAAVPATLGAILIAKVGNPGAVAKGGLVMGLLVSIVGGVGLLIAAITSYFKPETLDVAGKFMISMSKVFLMMVPLIFAAAAVGLAVMTFGPAALLVMAAGMATITGFVAVVSGTAVAVIKTIEDIPMSPGFETKSKIFLNVMDAIQKMVDSLVSILSLMRPSFMELISGVSFASKVDKAVELLRAFIGSKGSGTGIIGLIELVFNTIKELAGSGNSQKILAMANVFSQMLTAIADLTKGMTPPGEFFTAQTDFINVLDPSIGKSMDQTFKGYVQIFTDQVKGIIEQLKTTIETFLKYRSMITDVKKAEIIASLLSALSKAIVSVTPSKDVINIFKETLETSKSGASTLTKVDAKALTESMITNAVLAESIMKTMAEKVIPSLLKAGEGLTPAQLQQGLKIADLFKTLPDFINALSSVLQHGFSEIKQEKSATSETMFDSDKVVLFKNTTIVNKITETFDLLKKNLPDLIGTIVGFVSTMKVDPSFKQKADMLKTIFEAVKSVTDSIVSIGEVFKGEQKEGELKSASDLLTARSTELMQVGPVLGTFLKSFNITFIAEGIKQIHERMSKVAGGQNLKQSATAIEELFKAVTSLTGVMGQIPMIENPDSVGQNLKSIGDALQQFTKGEKGKSPFDVMKEAFVGTNSLGASASAMTGGITLFTKFFDNTFVPFVKSIIAVNAEMETAKENGGGLYSLAMTMKGLVGTEESRATLKSSLSAMAEDAEEVAASSIAPIVIAIQKINAEGKKLSDALTKGDWMTQIPVALKTFAQKSGTNLLGAAGKYTIGSTPVVINITLAVAMDAKQIETAVIMRKDSYIRDRVHYLLSLAAGSEATALDKLVKGGQANAALDKYEKDGKIPLEGDIGYASKENQGNEAKK